LGIVNRIAIHLSLIVSSGRPLRCIVAVKTAATKTLFAARCRASTSSFLVRDDILYPFGMNRNQCSQKHLRRARAPLAMVLLSRAAGHD
jgi:hypothetical protein